MTRVKKRQKIVMLKVALDMLRASAAETYKNEADGLLLGNELPEGILVGAVWPVTRADKRSYWRITTDTAHAIAEPFLEEWRVGGWHTHPDGEPTMSEGDREDGGMAGFELIVGVIRGLRKWCFSYKAYYEDENGKWHRADLVLPE